MMKFNVLQFRIQLEKQLNTEINPWHFWSNPNLHTNILAMRSIVLLNRTLSLLQGELGPKEETSLQVMDKLCKYVYAKDSTDRLRTRAILCHIYHHAIHDQWFEARDLMLMSHLQVGFFLFASESQLKCQACKLSVMQYKRPWKASSFPILLR